MTIDPEIIKIIEKTVKDEVSKLFSTIQLIQFKEKFMTREEFLDALNKMEERFKKSDERFNAVQKQMDDRFKKSDERFEAMQKQIDINYQELRSAIGNIGDRAGKGLQKAVIKLLKAQNKIRDIDFSSIKRVPIVDTEGVIFPEGFSTDIDVLMENGKTILIEIKFKIDSSEIFHFYNVAQLYEKLYKKPDELWVLSLEISPTTLRNAARFPIKIIYGKKKI